jgi:hypothetical protein
MLPVIFGNALTWMGLAVPKQFDSENLADSLAAPGSLFPSTLTTVFGQEIHFLSSLRFAISYSFPKIERHWFPHALSLPATGVKLASQPITIS